MKTASEEHSFTKSELQKLREIAKGKHDLPSIKRWHQAFHSSIFRANYEPTIAYCSQIAAVPLLRRKFFKTTAGIAVQGAKCPLKIQTILRIAMFEELPLQYKK